jgi:hypothetical protein
MYRTEQAKILGASLRYAEYTKNPFTEIKLELDDGTVVYDRVLIPSDKLQPVMNRYALDRRRQYDESRKNGRVTVALKFRANTYWSVVEVMPPVPRWHEHTATVLDTIAQVSQFLARRLRENK